jgi:hypothetical protein
MHQQGGPGRRSGGKAMNCPWCEREMQAGIITGDSRSKVRFQPEGVKYSFGDLLSGTGLLTAARYGWFYQGTPAHFCRHCKKMVIDTDVTK